ncbi:type 1 periplasmic-binding domain-containing protein [Streptomyces winkii]|uniref:hypothetical protein n=1 Tax=Streptomyces winkii TaxID=3051178 RepID=UPI0028D0EEBD|nr:hypothetical protein [Streptomyces sp. DSM 40971]
MPGSWRRALREDVLPVLVLDTDGPDAAATSRRARRTLDGLENMLVRSGGRAGRGPGSSANATGSDGGYGARNDVFEDPVFEEPAFEDPFDAPDGERLTPYARPAVRSTDPPGSGYLALKTGELLRATTPRRGAPLPNRHLRLMADLTAQIREHPEQPVPGGRALRDHAYSLRAEKAEGGLLHFLARFADVRFAGPLAWLGDLIALFGKSVLYRFPRWCWASWWTRRLLRSKHNWYEQWRRMGRTDESVFEKVAQLLTRQSERLRRDDEEAAEAAHQDLEELLLRALLADLRDAAPGKFGPRARRWRTRRVLLLDLPPAGAPGSAEAARLLRALRNTAGSPGSASLLVAAAGSASAYRKGDWRRCQNLRHGAELFAPVQDDDAVALPLLIPMTQQSFDEEGIFVTRVEPGEPWPGVKPSWEIAAEVVAGAAALAVLAALAPWPGDAAETACFDGTRVKGTHVPRPLPAHATEKNTARTQYESVVEHIRRLNDEAVKSERKADEQTRSTVRRVVYLGATVPSDPEEAIDNGAVPELRGLLLAQRRLNEEAVEDRENRVRLYVDVRDTGRNFADAEAEARRVVKEAERYKDSEDHRTVVGAVGFTESRSETRRAAAVLDEGQVPVIGTTATADAMRRAPESGKALTYYRPMSPSNSRESRIAASFARSERVVADDGGRCDYARRALVIEEPGDLFSSELSGKFAREFGPGAERLPLSESGGGGGYTPVGLAKTVCERIEREPRTIVYWAARVRNFSAFVNAYGPDSGCGGLPEKLTVLGSNELTSTALRGKYKEPWLRLYHSVHVLPEKHPDSGGQADRLFRDYVDNYTAQDPWLNDGHVALAHDALKVLSTAADDAYSSTGTAYTDLVKSKLDEEITFQGASGAIRFPELHGSRPPLDKALTILHVTAKGPEVALHCGAFKENEPPVTRWGPNGEHTCPTDG